MLEVLRRSPGRVMMSTYPHITRNYWIGRACRPCLDAWHPFRTRGDAVIYTVRYSARPGDYVQMCANHLADAELLDSWAEAR